MTSKISNSIQSNANVPFDKVQAAEHIDIAEKNSYITTKFGNGKISTGVPCSSSGKDILFRVDLERQNRLITCVIMRSLLRLLELLLGQTITLGKTFIKTKHNFFIESDQVVDYEGENKCLSNQIVVNV